MPDTSDKWRSVEALLLPPYHALHRFHGYAGTEEDLQYPLYLKAVADVHCALERSPLAGRYSLHGGLLLGWRRERRALPWDCWDMDLELTDEDVPLLHASLPFLKAAGWRHRVSWAHNGGRLAEVRFRRGAVYLDFFITERKGDMLATWVFAKQPMGWVQAEQHVPVTPLRPAEFLGLTWLVPDPVEPTLEAMYGRWQIPDRNWNYMESNAIVLRESWMRPTPPAPWGPKVRR